MRPSLTTNDPVDVTPRRAESGHELGYGHAGASCGANGTNGIGGDRGCGVAFSALQPLGIEARSVSVASGGGVRTEYPSSSGVAHVLPWGDPLEISESVVPLVEVNVVDVLFAGYQRQEGRCDKSMNPDDTMPTGWPWAKVELKVANRVNGWVKDAPGSDRADAAKRRHDVGFLPSMDGCPTLGGKFFRGKGVGMRVRFHALMVALLVAGILAGCSGVQPITVCYQVTAATVHGVDKGMTVAGELYKAGHLSEAAKEKLIAAHDVYRPAAQAAVAGCKAVQSQGDVDKIVAQLRTAADKVTEALVAAGVIR